MASKAEQAQQLIDNQLLKELMDEYQQGTYQDWRNAETVEAQQVLHSRARGADDFARWLQYRAIEEAGSGN